jgi:tagatose-6-phosphate ketose/aldose isomerase
MTSSFTGMLLAASLAFDLVPNDTSTALGDWADQALKTGLPLLEKLAHSSFERVVYLGSHALKGLAREAALKMLELSDGKVVALAETPLGFRHGPKTIINEGTLVVVLLGNDAYSRRYDLDLLRELRADGVAGRVLALTARSMDVPHPDDVVFSAGAGEASDLALCLPYAAFAQVLAFQQSLALGLRPDVPNARGTVSRVVHGVTIYPWGADGAA